MLLAARHPRPTAVCSFLFVALTPLSAYGQSAVASPPVLELPASVRVAGLMGAGVALVGDAGAIFTNPAGIATISHISLEGAYRRAPGGANLASGALAWRLGQFDLGFGVRRFSFGTDPGSYLGPAVSPGVEARELLGVGSLVYRFGLIALGASGKYVRRTVAGVAERGFSADAGVALAFFDIMALAFSMQNLRGNWKGSSPLPMPRLTRLGFTMNYVDPQESFRLMSALEVQWPEGASSRLVAGGEAGVVLSGVGIIARAGYAGTVATGSSRFTFGGTLTFGDLDLDYAFQATDVLGDTAHQLGLRLTL